MTLRPPRLLLWPGFLTDDDGIPSVAARNRLLCEEVVVHDDLTPNASDTAIVWKACIFLSFCALVMVIHFSPGTTRCWHSGRALKGPSPIIDHDLSMLRSCSSDIKFS